MKNKILLICIALITTLNITANIEEISLEEHYSERTQTLLDTLYGKNKFVVKADVTLSKPSYKVTHTEKASPIEKKETKKDKTAPKILPGYPAIRNLGVDEFKTLPFNSITTYNNPEIRKIDINIIAINTFPKGKRRKLEKIVTDFLNLKEKRDVINVSYQKFEQPEKLQTQDIIIKEANQNMLALPNVFYLIITLLLVIFIVLYTLLSRKSLNKIASSQKSEKSTPNINVSPQFEIPNSEKESRGNIEIKKAPDIKKYFDFITENNITSLIAIIKKEKINTEHIATILTFLSGSGAAKLLATLNREAQAVTTTRLLTQQQTNRPLLDKLEQKIKTALECFSGGIEPFQDTFTFVSGEVKKSILSELKKTNPTGYKVYRSNILLFEDISLLNNDEIKQVLSDINIEKLTIALSNTNEETSLKIKQNLTDGAKDMVNQSLDLKGNQATKIEIEAAQEDILNHIKALEKNGIIQLTKK